MKQLFAMAVPILPGKTKDWKKFIDELRDKRYNEFSQSRKKLGVRERTFLQSTPQGDHVLVTLEGEDPYTAFSNFAKGNDEFTKWFVSQVKEIHGFDLQNPPSGQLPEMVIDSMEAVLHH